LSDFLAYIFPRQTDVLLGGTHVDHDNRTEVCDTDTHGIIDRCTQLMPSLKNAQVKWISSGLRPGRPSVRVELESGVLHVPLVHNYGHGGAGMTLHWGCAQDVADMLRNHKQSRL
jgi:glycine/D-amino acid oxidase-like deaminating enzyme